MDKDKYITRVCLLSAPLENDYKHTLYFTDKDGQFSYFYGKKKYEFTNFFYQRKDSYIRVPVHADELMSKGINYVMYQNSAYSNKWFYAFITDIKYVTDERSDVFIETDCIQSWLFDYQVKESFVEREHVSDDTIGKHTVPEQLETGEYICNKKIQGRSFKSNVMVVGSTVDLADTDSELFDGAFDNVSGCMCNGIYNGVKYYHFTSEKALNALLANVAKKGKSDAIVSIFMGAPEFYDIEQIEDKSYSIVKDSNSAKTVEWTVAVLGGDSILPPEKPTQLDGYTPVNKKLLTFPYCYLLASNNNGGNAIYHYEKFSSSNCEFQFKGSLTPGMSIRLQPLNYDGQEVNNLSGLSVGKLPICSWSNDVYTNWLTQQSVNLALGAIGGIGLMSTGHVLTGAMTIAGSLAPIYQHSLIPPQAEGNINNGDVTYSSGNARITMEQISIKKEFAKIIDKYFSMFGYKVNMVKTPNKAHRGRWWFTKTIDVNIDGAIPMKDMEVIKKCYNNGITFWRNGNEIQNYSLSNDIV